MTTKHERLLGEIRAKGSQFKEARISRAAVDEKNRTVEIAFASEEPYRRWWGVEILDCAPKSVRLGRLRDGANLLCDHNARDVIGVVERARVDPDRVCRATVRFGRSARAQEVFQDVIDGIRSKVSVGYIVHDLVLEKQEGDISTYRVVDFEPLEVSLVAIPADATVGVGRSVEPSRSAHIGGHPMSEQHHNAPGGAEPSPAQAVLSKFNTTNEVVRQQAFDEFASRNAEIQAIGKKFSDFGAKELADAAVVDPKMTVDAFREAVLALVEKKQSAPTRTGQLERDRMERSDAPAYGMGARDMLHGLSARSFEGVGKLLRMSDQEAAYRAGMFLKGVMFGNPDALRWCADAGMELKQGRLDGASFAGEQMGTRALSGGIFTSAGWLMPAELSTAIIVNREQYGVARRICNMIPMTTNTLALPRLTSGVTAYFVGEGSTGTESSPAGDQVNLTLKDLMCTTIYGNSTAQDSAIPLADMIAREQARGRAVKEDACLVIGDGTSTYGGMQGFRTLLNSASYSAGVAAAASGHDTFAEVDNADIATLLGHLPVYARAGARFVCSGIFDATVFARLKLIAGGNTVQTVQGTVVEGSYAGFPITIAHDMPGSATNGAIMVAFGNFDLGVAFGYGQAMMMTVDPYSLSTRNQTQVTTVERIDINCHGVIKSSTAGAQGPIVGLDATT